MQHKGPFKIWQKTKNLLILCKNTMQLQRCPIKFHHQINICKTGELVNLSMLVNSQVMLPTLINSWHSKICNETTLLNVSNYHPTLTVVQKAFQHRSWQASSFSFLYSFSQPLSHLECHDREPVPLKELVFNYVIAQV